MKNPKKQLSESDLVKHLFDKLIMNLFMWAKLKPNEILICDVELLEIL